MTKRAILITGANGEVGHGLIKFLLAEGKHYVVALDLKDMHEFPATPQFEKRQGDILDPKTLEALKRDFSFDVIYHLAALLSTSGEKDPLRAHRVNVEGTLNLLELAREQSEREKQAVKFIFPSTIAAYGMSLEEKNKFPRVKEDEFLNPITMYGANKIYIEKLGAYYSKYFRFLEEDGTRTRIDFRGVRFPGLISADTVPTGGTSDYAAEMVHAAVKGEPYECFVKPESQLPFMAMPDAVKALIDLSRAKKENLTRLIYNVSAFSLPASQIQAEVTKYFPNAKASYKPHQKRLQIVETWPADIDDDAAKKDWGWKPTYDKNTAFETYLIPGVMKHYGVQSSEQKRACC